MGLIGYYNRFVQTYGKITQPLTTLCMSTGALRWTAEADKAFVELKRVMTTAPVLALPNFSQEFIIETDASGNSIGAVLMQQCHPVVFISKALSSKHQALSSYDKEMLAILFVIKKWHFYLVRRYFTIRTDHQPLKYLLEHKVTTPSQHIWLAKLMAYDFNIVYKKGAENKVADALSRISFSEILCLVVSSGVMKIIKDLEQNPIPHKNFTWERGQLRRKGRLVVRKDTKLQAQILLVYHSSGLGGHFGVHATYQRISSILYWKGLWKTVREFIRTYTNCQQNKFENVAYPGLLQPLLVLKSIFSNITMDFI